MKTRRIATRSTFRPNGIGQSVVKLHGVVQRKGKGASKFPHGSGRWHADYRYLSLLHPFFGFDY